MIQIILTERSSDWHAHLYDHKEIWGCGRTPYQALGNLIHAHEESLGITLFYAPKETPKVFPNPADK